MDGGLVGMRLVELVHPFSERHHPRIRDSDAGVPPRPIAEIGLDVLTFSSTVVLSAISCWLLLKSVPCLVAQKDAVHFGSFSEKKG